MLPVLAGGAAFAIVSQEPQQYEASMIVTIPSSISETDGALTVYSDNFQETIGTEKVLRAVSRDVGIPAGILDAGITATRLKRSILIEVTFTGEGSGKAGQVVSKAARYTLEELAKPKVAAAKAAVTLARSRYDRVRAATYRFYRSTGLVIPVEVYTTKLSELSQLERAYEEVLDEPPVVDSFERSTTQTNSTTQTSSPGRPANQGTVSDQNERRREQMARIANQAANRRKAAALQLKIARLKQELASLRPKVLRYRELEAEATGSLSLLTAAQKDLLDASNLAAASSSPLTLSKAVVTPIPRPQVIARGVGVSMGLAFVLAIGLLAVLELLWPSRGSGRHSRANGRPPAVVVDPSQSTVGVRMDPAPSQTSSTPWGF
jgi:hypothetical protein